MILRLFRRTPREDIIASLYGTIVAQARAPAFYRIYGVPDTVNGRLEMIMLHAVLLLRRLEEGAVSELGQAVFDRFCRDMDESMREMGVGDLAVPKKMRRIGEAFYGRQAVYRAALAVTRNDPLAAALERNVFAGALGGDGGLAPVPAVAEAMAGARRLACYVREAVVRLAAQDGFERGELAFPDPEQVLVHP